MKKWILFLIFLGITANADYLRMSQPDDTRELNGLGFCGGPFGGCG